MKPTPIHMIVTRMKRLPLRHQAAHLKALIDAESPRSIRRSELEHMLKDVNLRRLKSERVARNITGQVRGHGPANAGA